MLSQADEHDLIRGIANAMRHIRDFSQHLPTEARATRLLFRVVKATGDHQGAKLRGGVVHHQGQRRSLKALTFKHTKLPLRLWLAAIWHLHVDERSIAARQFARRYGIDKMSAWRLLSRVRRAFLLLRPASNTVKRQTLGRHAPTNRARCASTIEAHRLFLLDAHEAPPAKGRSRTGAFFMGYFDRWLAVHFRGIHERNHARYAAEYADRFRRAQINAGYTAAPLLTGSGHTAGPLLTS